MAITPETGASKVEDGPTIDNKPSKILTFDAVQLRASPLIPSLIKTVNMAYRASEKENLGISMGDRLGSVDELILVLRDDPESFTITLIQPHAPEDVLCTATCRRYFGVGADASIPWACTHNPDQGVEEWELKLLATHPTAQGKGVASFMLALAEKEVVARFQAKFAAQDSSTVETPEKVKMILCTPKSQYGQYYTKRGYHEDYIRMREKPDIRFEITFMSKVLQSGMMSSPFCSGFRPNIP